VAIDSVATTGSAAGKRESNGSLPDAGAARAGDPRSEAAVASIRSEIAEVEAQLEGMQLRRRSVRLARRYHHERR